MTLISLNTAAYLTGVSKRTIWRRIAAGNISVVRSADLHGKTLLSLDDIAMDIGLPLEGEIIAAVRNADAGLARDQLELALVFLEAGLAEKALPWLELAAKQGEADAMLTLGETQLSAPAAAPQAGLIWIRRAAIVGHPVALAVMEGLPGQLRGRDNFTECPLQPQTTPDKKKPHLHGVFDKHHVSASSHGCRHLEDGQVHGNNQTADQAADDDHNHGLQ